MQLSLNARLTRHMLSSPEPDYSNSGWSLNYGANWSYALTTGFKFNAYAGQTTRNYNLQGHDDGWYYYGISISKDFLRDNALTVTVNANNFLQGHTTFRSMSATESTLTRQRFTNNNWNAGLTIAWNFGKLNSDVKKTAVGINNDDTSNVTGKSKGGL